MSVPIEDIKPGAVFQFKKAQRRVVRLDGKTVYWEYADGPRAGKSGSKHGNWINYFAYDANPIDGKPKPTYAELEAEVAALRGILREVHWRMCAKDRESGSTLAELELGAKIEKALRRPPIHLENGPSDAQV